MVMGVLGDTKDGEIILSIERLSICYPAPSGGVVPLGVEPRSLGGIARGAVYTHARVGRV
jgi:hypothetical protein